MKILKLDKDTFEVLSEYNTFREAAESVGCKHGAGIREACVWAHIGRNSRGYKWFAMDENTNLNYYRIILDKESKKFENISLEQIKEILIKKNKINPTKEKTSIIKCPNCKSIELFEIKTINNIDYIEGVGTVVSYFECNECNNRFTVKYKMNIEIKQVDYI